MFSAILAIVIFTSAYIAEIIRSGIESIEKEQILAAQSLALNSYQTMEYIILPQAISRMKPALCAICDINQRYIAGFSYWINRINTCSEIVYETQKHEFEVLIFVALIYILLNTTIQKLFFSQKSCIINLSL